MTSNDKLCAQAYGRKKTHKTIEGHQDCGTCHPVQKNKKRRAREMAKTDASTTGEVDTRAEPNTTEK